MSAYQEDASEMDDYVTLPRKNADWREAIVKWTRYDYVALYDYPTTNESETVMEIYKGDMVQVSARFKRGDWCLCQVGHVLGWVFLKDVRFIVQSAVSSRPEYHQVYTDTSEVETQIPRAMPVRNHYEVETQVSVRRAVHEEELQEEAPVAVAAAGQGGGSKYDNKPMITRLINFFKR